MVLLHPGLSVSEVWLAQFFSSHSSKMIIQSLFEFIELFEGLNKVEERLTANFS
jgi:hypothetical protein